MRIIAGSAKGKHLKSPRGKSKVRPTSDKVKTAFFNMVAEHIVDAKFLDLFAGTGNIGIEALSRGARQSVFVEKNVKIMQLLRENLELTALIDSAALFCCGYELALRVLNKKKEAFDIIYLDPPYHYRNTMQILILLDKFELIAPGGIIGVEKKLEDKQLKKGEGGSLPFLVWRKKNYGNTILTLYRPHEVPSLTCRAAPTK